MTCDPIDRVFGRGRLQMVTGAHVEVFREASAPGESRRYTKRFLTTADGDYAQWTEREWRILARLIGHGARCVPDVVQYDRDARGTKLVQTYDAGATVDQWATLLPVQRGDHRHEHVFQDCAHWWALAHHCLVALDEIHSIQLVHLDIKGDNICIPVGPAHFDAHASDGTMFPVFRKLALIDFAFSLVSGETLTTPLPIGWQQDYDYQSPRLLRALEAGRAGDLQPTEALDWRCDMYSLAAMLKRYLPAERLLYGDVSRGWTDERYDAARSLILRIRDAHDVESASLKPHAGLIAVTSAQLGDVELARSLERGWHLTRDSRAQALAALPLTPVTRLAPPVRPGAFARDEVVSVHMSPIGRAQPSSETVRRRPTRRIALVAAGVAMATIVGGIPFVVDVDSVVERASALSVEGGRTMSAALRSLFERNDASPAPVDRTGHRSSEMDVAMSDAAPSGGDVSLPATTTAQDTAATQDTTTARDTTPAHAAPTAPTTATPAPPTATQPPTPGASLVRSPSAPAVESTRLPPAGRSLAEQIEAYRGKSLEAASKPARTQASSTVATRASAPRAGERSARAAAATRQARPSNSGPVVRAQTPVAVKSVAGAPTPTDGRARRTPASSVASVATPPRTTANVGAKAMIAIPAGQSAVVTAVTPPTSMPTSPAASPLVAVAPQQPHAVDAATRSSPPTAAVTHAIAPPAEVPRPVAVPAPAPVPEDAPPAVATTRTHVSPPIQQPRLNAVTPVPEARGQRAPVDDVADADYFDEGRRMLAGMVPRSAPRIYDRIARVLWVAANAHHHAQERAVTEAFMASAIATDAWFASRDRAPEEARRLHEEARHAYMSRRHVPDALDLQITAFGANPIDAEIAGMLAFLHLRTAPAQPERARQLALHALGIRSAQHPTGRPEDWITFAIASALTGRHADAKNALYTTLALSGLDRSCRAALAALATYGERVREPVEALLARLYWQGRDDDSPHCVRHASRSAVARFR